jgi:hypothetical protein
MVLPYKWQTFGNIAISQRRGDRIFQQAVENIVIFKEIEDFARI